MDKVGVRMKKWLLLLPAVPAVLLAAWAAAGPISGKSVIRATVGPGEEKPFEGITLRGNEPARIIVIGDGRAPLHLYVLDARNNIIAKDTPPKGDDLALVLNPVRNESYTI